MRSRPKIATSRRATRRSRRRSRRSWKGATRTRRGSTPARRARSRRRRRLLRLHWRNARRLVVDAGARVLAVSRPTPRARRRSNPVRRRVQGRARDVAARRPGKRPNLKPMPRVVQDDDESRLRLGAQCGPGRQALGAGTCARFDTKDDDRAVRRRDRAAAPQRRSRGPRRRCVILSAAPSGRSPYRPRFRAPLRIKARRVEGRHRVVRAAALRLPHVLVLEGHVRRRHHDLVARDRQRL